MAPPETRCGSPAMKPPLPPASSGEKDLCASLRFSLLRVDGRARTSVVHLPHGDVRTPIFMPVGTYGAVKGLTCDLMHALHNEMIDRERGQGKTTKKRNALSEEEEGRNEHSRGDKRNTDGGGGKVGERYDGQEERKERDEEVVHKDKNMLREEKKSVKMACRETDEEEERSKGKKIRRDCSTRGESHFPYPNHTYFSHEEQRHRTSSILSRSFQTSPPSNSLPSFPFSSAEKSTTSSAPSSSSSLSSPPSRSSPSCPPLSSSSSPSSPSSSSFSSSFSPLSSVCTPCGDDRPLRRPPASFSPIILGNTFHLYLSVGIPRMQAAGGLHNFMRWGGNLLTDSGGFQMVSLFKIIDVREEGVEFDAGSLVSSQQQKSQRRDGKGRGGGENKKKQKRALEDKGGGGEQAKAIVGSKGEGGNGDSGLHKEKKEDDERLMEDKFLLEKGEKEGQMSDETEEGNNSRMVMLTPEKSIHMQNAMGSDIIMQLDDVVSSTTPDPVRVEEAMYRSLRWLDRCIAAHNRPEDQALFGIVQGGLDARTRTISLQEIRKRPLPGFAIGGLSGGEAKEDFWKMVELSTRPGGIGLPENKPRYLMGVGYPVDILVCVALGCDMFDCVYPCRTARFGTALVRLPGGVMRIKQNRFKEDLRSLDPSCGCYTCRSYSRAFLHAAFGKATAAAQLLTIHNLFFMQTFCTDMQRAIEEGKFSAFAREFIQVIYPPPSRQKKIDKEASLSSSFFVSPDMKKSVLVQREDTGSTGGEAVVQRGVRERGEEDEEVGKEEEDQKNGLTKRGEEGEDTTGRGGEEEGDSQEGDTMQHSDRENEKEKNTSVDGDQKTVEEDSMSSRGKKKKKRTGKREEGKEENMKTGARNVDQDVACSTSEKSTSSPPLWVYEALKAAGIDISDLYDHFSTEETKTTAMPSNERP